MGLEIVFLAVRFLVGGGVALIPTSILPQAGYWLLLLGTSTLQVVAVARGQAPGNRSASWQWFLYDRRIRILLFGLQGWVADFVVLMLAILGTLLLQGLGLLRRVPYSYNVRNLLVRWPITVMIAVAFIFVVGLMTVMLAFVNGMYALTKGSAVAGNVMVLADGATDELFSDIGYGDIGTLVTKDYVKKTSLDFDGTKREVALLSWELYQVVSQKIPNAKPGGRMRRFVQVRGVEEPVISGAVHELPLHEGGTWFDPGAGVQSVQGGGKEQYVQGVLGEGLAREMGSDYHKSSLAVGDTFELGPRRWIVVGIMKSAGKTYDSEVWAKRTVVGEMLRKNTRSTAAIRVAEGLNPADVAQDMAANFKSPAISARTEADYFDSLNETNKQFLYAIIGVALFMAVGGVFGVMNTMFAAISQRTRDIGVLRILGYPRWQILSSFFLESLLLAVIGGLFGIGIGSLTNGWSATSQLTNSQGGGRSVMLKLVVDSRILACGLGFSLLMGCLGGLLPALSAIRMKVLDSLR